MTLRNVSEGRFFPRTTFKAGDTVRLLPFEELPERHKRSGYIRRIQDNAYKMALLDTEMTIERVTFSKPMGEWRFQMEEDQGDWIWLEDMFYYNRPPKKGKAQNGPQMPLI